ncbi:MAG: hypothetical protein PHI02_06985 [Sulfurovaceae bacterium]|nr:hypothetical protein [Sulfurovaceae bacterium]
MALPNTIDVGSGLVPREDLTPISEEELFEDALPQIEKIHYATGGENGIMNIAAWILGNRTKWLKAQMEALAATSYSKEDIDTLLQGLKPKASVKVATTANITLSGTQSIDGIAVIAGERVLVKNQTSAAQNGIYIVAAGAWTRSFDANSASELIGASVFVEQGTTNSDTMWVQTTDNITLETTSITWVKFAGNGAFQASSAILTAIAALTSGVGFLSFNNGAVSLANTNPTGQWTDVTASRTIGTIYTNTTNKPIEVIISADSSNAIFWRPEINGVAIDGDYIAYRATMSFMIYPGDTYKITTSSGAVPNDFYKVYERN